MNLRDWEYDCISVKAKKEKKKLSLEVQSDEMEKAMFLKVLLRSYVIMIKNLWQGTNSEYHQGIKKFNLYYP